MSPQPCPDPKCKNGKIIVHNAYSKNPLKGEEQDCDRCGGKGFLILRNPKNCLDN